MECADVACGGGWCEGGTDTGTDCRVGLCVYKGSLVMLVWGSLPSIESVKEGCMVPRLPP